MGRVSGLWGSTPRSAHTLAGTAMSESGIEVDEVTLARLAREARSPIADAVELDDPIPLTEALKDAVPGPGRGQHWDTDTARAHQSASRESLRSRRKAEAAAAEIERQKGIIVADMALDDVDMNGRLETIADKAVRRNLSLILNGGEQWLPKNGKEAVEMARACAAIAAQYRTGRAAEKIIDTTGTEQIAGEVRDRLLELAARAKARSDGGAS